MMGGMKDEEKGTSPMFPRVHVNDAEKGCQRAPPRNKMALYEQLSIPSQRFSSGSAPLFPLPPTNSSSTVPSTSPTHIGGRRRIMLTSFCKPPKSTHGVEKLTSYSSTVVKLNDMEKEETKAPVLRITRPLSSDYRWNKNEDNKISTARHFFLEQTMRDEDEVRVPISAQTPKDLTNGKKNKDGDFSSQQFQTPGTHSTGACSTDLNSRRMATGHAEEKKKMTLTNQLGAEKSALFLKAINKPSVDATISPSKLEISKRIECRAESSGHISERIECLAESSRPERSSFDHISNRLPPSAEGTLAFKHEKLVRPKKDIGEKNGSILRGKSCLVPSVKDDQKTSLKNESRSEEDKNCDSIYPKHSVTYNMNSASANIISPDDVVGVIGEKQFWDARKMIINQQRIFALQIFELHRVIKVQRLLAESPHLLLEDDLYSKKSTMKVPTPKKLPTESALQPLPLSSSDKDQSRFPISPQPCNTEALKELVTNQSHDDLHSINIRQASMGTNAKLEPWCFPALPASQWLVPVMSPSEGLIYKPLTGICPPNAGFFNPAYGVPHAAKQVVEIPPKTPPLNHAYFPPYGLPVNHQSLSCSAVEQTSPRAKTRSNGQDIQASAGEINNYAVRNQHSHNMSSQTSQVMTCQAEKGRGLKGSELQGSTASSPMVWANVDLPLFPMAPTVEESDQNRETSENKSRVIKVVPHNPRTATESAARIFQLIQEERKQI